MQLVRTGTATSFKNILFLTDFSGASTRALAYALAFARHFKARLYPAHVVDSFLTESGSIAGEPAIVGMEERKRQQLARQVEYNGIEFHPLLSRCDFEAAVPHWVAEYGIDLIVLGTHGRRGIQRFLLGSTSEWVVRSGLCPVLTVGPYVDVPRLFSLNINRVLYPTGLTDRAPGISLQYALALTEETCARLLLLHVLPEESRDYQDRTRILRFTLDELQELVPAEARSRCRPEFAVDAGEPAARILVHARNEHPDLIVMGLPRKHASEDATGSGVAYRVISLAQCPVLTVPEEEKE
jgi:nucleotide-binding universal stress UspA family protein